MTMVHDWGETDKSDTERIKTEKRRKHGGRNMISHGLSDILGQGMTNASH